MKKLTSRQKAKTRTRFLLLAAAKREFIRIGLLRVSTVDIARRAGVAHGTLFFHFRDKETLLAEVLDGILLALTDELQAVLGTSGEFSDLLEIYMDFLEREERLYSTIARELPLYPPEFRRMIQGREAAVRQYFYQALEVGMEKGVLRRADITSTLNFLFGTLHYYLALREAFVSRGSVIREKRRGIRDTLIRFLSL